MDCEGCMIAKCKIGYKGDRCQFCSDASTLIEGTNGKVDSKGAGVKCGKFQCYLLILKIFGQNTTIVSEKNAVVHFVGNIFQTLYPDL